MKKLYAALVDYKRINGSNLGNPNYEVIIKHGDDTLETLRSSSNSSWCYGISDQWLHKTITYTLTRAGRIDYMQVTTMDDIFTDPMLAIREEGTK